ncbi:DUF1758 domain-containing protein [Trichonephila clavipes]|nr:DUF1758 domain-containing protein [Trichonephila clavipes]
MMPSVKTFSAKNGSWIHELKTKKHILKQIFKKTQVPLRYFFGRRSSGKVITGRREELKTGLVALETKLGWTLMGKVPRYRQKGYKEWLAEGVIEEIPGKELPVRTHYLPHRPVVKRNIRNIFNEDKTGLRRFC